MALENIKGLTQDEQFEEAAKFAGVPASVLRGMWATESSKGTRMLSPAGARGHFGLMPKTQATWEQREGRKFDPDDFSDAITMAALTLKENLGSTKGNVADALRMYDSGTDRSKWDNPETKAYPSKVLGTDVDTIAASSEDDVATRMGATVSRLTPEDAWTKSAYDLMELQNKEVSGAGTKEYLSDVEKGLIDSAGAAAAAAAIVGGNDATPATAEARAAVQSAPAESVKQFEGALAEIKPGADDGTAWEAVIDANVAGEEEQKRIDEIGVTDRFAAAFNSQTLTGGLMRWYEKQGTTSRFDPNFDYMANIDEIEKDATPEEVTRLREAMSQGEVGLIRADINWEREQEKTLTEGASGLNVGLTSLAAGIFDPVGWLAGAGAGKVLSLTGQGARAAFVAGNTTRGFALAGVEGAVGNVAVTAGLDAMGQYQSTSDYASSTAFGFVFGSAFGVAEWRGAAGDVARQEFEDLANRISEHAAKQKADLFERAVAEAGPGADADEVARVAKRLDAEDNQRILDVIFGDVPDEMRIFPRPDPGAEPVAPGVVEVRAPGAEIPDTFVAKTKGGEFRLTDVEAPAGADFSEFGQVRIVEAFDGDEKIGELLYANDGTPPTISVEPSHQRKGVATAMLKLAKERGGVLGDAQTGVAGKGRPIYRTDEGQAFRSAADESTVELSPAREADVVTTKAAPKSDSLPGAILNTRKKRKDAYKRYGLDVSIADDAERKLVAETFARAERILGTNPVDVQRLKPLLSKVGWEATSTRMLLSDNPVMRAFAVIALENPEGAAGRKVTASMTKAMRERVYLGNALREYDSAYALWRTKNGGSALRDFHDGTLARRFDKEVYAERDRRYNGKEGGTDDPAVLMAADTLDSAYNRMLQDQHYVKTVGSARLPTGNVRGYQPRRSLPGVVAGLNDAQRRAVVSALSGEFQATAGFDKEFSDRFAIEYIQRINTQAKGAYDVPMNLHSDDAADIVRDSLRAMSMNEEQINTIMGRFSRGGASHTKSRIDADLTTMYPDGAGGNLQLMDIFNTDNRALLRQYARRVSGEVALTKYGIMGEQGLKELRIGMSNGPDGMKASVKELEAFDQVAAEFLGKPFGTQLGKWADNARSFTSALRLGGMGFNQFNEYANGVAALGVTRSMKAVAALPRLLGEVRALKNGKPAPNSILGSLELYGGEFGADGYRMQGMYDVNDGFEVYGMEPLTVFDKAVRGGAHANRILSMHRAITSVQIRGMAEQIVAKSMRYIREGTEDAALLDMGFTPEVRAAVLKDINKIAKFGPDGELLSFDITKLEDNAAAHAYITSVYRGASQIIQETYIGETGKWAHDGWLKLLTQFRTYGITATQKQWRRQAFTHGSVKALGFLLGSMSVALPIHMARVQLKAMGRSDREEYLDKQLSPMALGRNTMNYVAAIGLLPDVVDIASGLTGGSVTGGRAGNTSPFVGGQIIPAAGVANDIYRAAQTRDPHRLARLVPGSNLPYLQVLVNQLDE